MGKLIVVSNRVPAAGKTEAGGLSVALSQALIEQGGTWVGWSGAISDTPQTQERIDGNVRYSTVDLTQTEYNDFYAGYCNSVLWPLFHYRMDLCQYGTGMYEAYQQVNRKFADLVVSAAKPQDMIWVHDYHLLPLGSYLRDSGLKQRMGFFIHIPFPVPEVLMAMPHYQDVLTTLSAYDVVGFQTESDLLAFIRCVTALAKKPQVQQLDDATYEITAFGRTFKAGKFSISIDTNELMVVADQSEIDPQTIKLRESLGGRQMLIGVDRLDYTKGLIERLGAYQQLLEQWPDYRDNISYVQITPPSRTDVSNYIKIREQLETMAARINGLNSEINWVPIRYINRSFTRGELAGFYRAARVGLVTPLRDGMNLVAKEYVASQNPDDPGVLVLSHFAGAASELECGALMVNPYNAGEMAAQIHRALSMPLEERQERYRKMITVLRKQDIFLWSKRFLNCLSGKQVYAPDGQIQKAGGRLLGSLGKLASHILPFGEPMRYGSVAE